MFGVLNILSIVLLTSRNILQVRELCRPDDSAAVAAASPQPVVNFPVSKRWGTVVSKPDLSARVSEASVRTKRYEASTRFSDKKFPHGGRDCRDAAVSTTRQRVHHASATLARDRLDNRPAWMTQQSHTLNKGLLSSVRGHILMQKV